MARLIVFLIIIGSIVGGLSYSLWSKNNTPSGIDFNKDVNMPKEEDNEPGNVVEKIKQENSIAGQILKRENNLKINKQNMGLEKIEGFHPQKNNVLETGKTYNAKIKTSVGEILVELNSEQVPVTVNNFVYLASTGFYENVIFHRIIKDFMIQGGDPTGSGSGGPGYKFDDEKFTGKYSRGTLAMANAGSNTNGSQFFIMHADVALPPNYTIFGKVTEGLDVVDAIATAETSPGGEGSSPTRPVKIESVEIIVK